MHEHELKKNAVVKGQVLIVCTSHDRMDGEPTGCWLEELAAPYYVFKDSGYDVTISSVKGGPVPMDPSSLAENFQSESTRKFQADDEAQQQLHHSVPLSQITEPKSYDAVFLPGGHGTVFDFIPNPHLAEIVSTLFNSGKVVSAVCHGPAGLLEAKDTNGKPIVAGRRVTGFSNSEEEAVGKTKLVPFLLEDKLKELGGKYEKTGDWQVHAVADGKLVTGQNPQSSHKTAELVVHAMQS